MNAVDRMRQFIAELSAAELHEVSVALAPHLAVVASKQPKIVQSLEEAQEYIGVVLCESLSRFASNYNGPEEVSKKIVRINRSRQEAKTVS